MAARKTRLTAVEAPHPMSSAALSIKLAEAKSQIAELTAALEAEHKKGVEWANERERLNAELDAAKAAHAKLQDDNGALVLDQADRARERESLLDQVANLCAQIRELQADLKASRGEASYFATRDTRGQRALVGLAFRLGEAEAYRMTREDHDARQEGGA